MLNGAMYVSCPVLFRQPNPPENPLNLHLFFEPLASHTAHTLATWSLQPLRRAHSACTRASSPRRPL